MKKKHEIVDNFSDLFVFQIIEGSGLPLKKWVVDSRNHGTGILYAAKSADMTLNLNLIYNVFLCTENDRFRLIPTKVLPFSAD